MTIKTLIRTLIFVLVTCCAPLSFAHNLDQGYIFLTIEDNAIHGRVETNIRDLNTALGLSIPSDGSATIADIEPHLPTIKSYLTQGIDFTVDGDKQALQLSRPGLFKVTFAHFLQLHFEVAQLPRPPTNIDVAYRLMFDKNPDFRGMLVVETNWKTTTFNDEANVALVFAPGTERQTLDLSSSTMLRGFVGMIGLGVHHIWIGIDHILFLLALLLPAVVTRRNGQWVAAASFRVALIHVIKVVTIFTVAHSITLSLAALGLVSLSSRLVESVIALSIALATINIFLPVFRDKTWWIVFLFGLFHGFGFASVMGEIGIPSNYLVHSLLGFNIGVELGQVVIVLAIFPVLFLLRRYTLYTRYLLPAIAALLIIISVYWFIERAFVIDLPAGAFVNRLLAWFS